MVCRVRVDLEWEEEEMNILQPSCGGDTLKFFARAHGPSIYCLPQKYQKYQA